MSDDASATSPTASGSIEIDAPAARVYELITDLSVLSQLAEETASMHWTSGSSATPGSRFTGANRNGWRRWSTRCTVTDAEPGALFAFDVTFPLAPVPVSRWQYEITSSGEGCTVTESTWNRLPGAVRGISAMVAGEGDRDGANHEHIAATLRRLKERAEN